MGEQLRRYLLNPRRDDDDRIRRCFQSPSLVNEKLPEGVDHLGHVAGLAQGIDYGFAVGAVADF